MTRDEALISAALEMAARRINSDDMRWLSRCQVADAIRAIDVDEALAGLPTAPDAVARDAVLEEAAKALERFAENLDCGHPESRLCDCGPFVEQWGFAADEVRALKSSVQPEPILSPAATETVPVPVARLVEAARALGAMPEGYCFCSANRVGDDSKIHEPECADLRAALVAKENEQCQVSIGPAIGATINGLHGSGAGAPDAVDNSYTDDLIDLIGEFGREVYYLLDDCETSGPVGEEIHTITEDGLRKVSAIIDRIDDLPFGEPGVILGTGAMLQAAIMQTFAHPPQPSASVVEAMKQETSHDRT